MAITNSNESFISRLPEEDRQAIAAGNAKTESVAAEAPKITHSTPREAVQAIHDYKPPTHADLAPLTYGQQQEALTTYNANRADLAQDAIATYAPTIDQFSALPPAVAQIEYNTALVDYRNDPYVGELHRIRYESTQNPFETPTSTPDIDALPGFSSASPQSGATTDEAVNEALDNVVVAQEGYDTLVELASNGNTVAMAELRLGSQQQELATAEAALDVALRDAAETRGDPRDRSGADDLAQVDEITQSYQGGDLGRQLLERSAERVTTDIQVDDTLARAERISDPEVALDYLNSQAEKLGGDAARIITGHAVYAQAQTGADTLQTEQAAADYENLSGGIVIYGEFDNLLVANVDRPAYLAELVRLANEDGWYGTNEVGPNWLFEKNQDGSYRRTDDDIPDIEQRREAVAASISAALDYGVLSEADIRNFGVGREGWQDIASRIGIGQVGSTDATMTTQVELGELQSAHSDAQSEVQKLDEELAGMLAVAGPLTPTQQADFIEAYRADPQNKEIYDEYYATTEALADYVSRNQTEIIDASVRDPSVAEQTAATITTLAENGHGVEALELLSVIHADPTSPTGEAFADFTELHDQTLIDASSSAAAQLLAENDGDAIAANQALQDLIAPIAQALPAGRGQGDVRLGLQLLDNYADGNFSNTDVYARQYDIASPAFRMFAAAGFVLGSASAIRAGTEGDYLNAINGFANAGENGLRLVAGAANSLTDTGRIAQYAGRFAGDAGFAARLAPGLGLIANSASLVNSIQHAANGNIGYAFAALGDTIGVLGSAIELIPGAQPVGFVVSGIGVLISSVGSFIGEAIYANERYEQIEDYLIEAGVDEDIAHNMARTGRTLDTVADDLNLGPAEIQSILSDHPEIGDSKQTLRLFSDAAQAFGLTGGDVHQFADALAQDSEDIGSDLIFANMRYSVPVGQTDEGKVRFAQQTILENFPAAVEYLEGVSPELFTPQAEQRTAAVREFEAIILNGYGDERSVANLLNDNTDPAYRAQMIELVDEYFGGVERFAANLAIGSTSDQLNAAYDAIVDAFNAGVIDEQDGLNALERLES